MKWEYKKGFTLVELVVVIAILGILAGIAIPRFMEATKESKKVTCLSNRKIIERSFLLAEANGEYTNLTDFLAAIKSDETVVAKYFKDEPICPSGGTYSVSDTDHIICSIEDHQDDDDGAIVDTGDNGTGNTGDTGSGDNGDTGTGDTGDTGTAVSIDDLEVTNWSVMLNDAATTWGAQVGTGLYSDETGVYLILNNKDLTKDDGEDNITLEEYAMKYSGSNIAKIDLDAEPFTSANKTSDESGNVFWDPDNLPTVGTIYKDGDDYYVCKYDAKDGYTGINVTNSDQWLKVSL